jgi:hypothetical protein
MDEAKLNASFEAKIAEAKKRKQAEAEEAERIRIANEPAEREKTEATDLLRQELRDLGRMFVVKADELNVPPNVEAHPKQGIDEQWYKRYNESEVTASDNFSSVGLVIFRDGNIFASVPEHHPGTCEPWVIRKYSTAEPPYEKHISDANCTPLRWYESFSADTICQAEQTIGMFTTAVVDFLGELVVEAES